jgi:hypothetical protein
LKIHDFEGHSQVRHPKSEHDLQPFSQFFPEEVLERLKFSDGQKNFEFSMIPTVHPLTESVKNSLKMNLLIITKFQMKVFMEKNSEGFPPM